MVNATQKRTHPRPTHQRNDTKTMSANKSTASSKQPSSSKRPAPEPITPPSDNDDGDDVLSECDEFFPPPKTKAKRQEPAVAPSDTPKVMRAVSLPTGVCATYEPHGFVAIKPKDAGDEAPGWLKAVQVKTTDGKMKIFNFVVGEEDKTARAVGYLTVNVNAAFKGFPTGTVLTTTTKKRIGDILAAESGFIRRLPSAIVDGVEVASSDDSDAVGEAIQVGHDIAFATKDYTKATKPMQNAGFVVQHHLAAPVLWVGGADTNAAEVSVNAVEKIKKLELTIADRDSGKTVTASMWANEAFTFFGVEARFLDTNWFKKRSYVLYLSPQHLQESSGRYTRPYTIAAVTRLRSESEPSYVMKSELFKAHLKKKVIELNKTDVVAQGKKAPPNAVKQQKQALRDGMTLPMAFFDTDEAVDAVIDVKKARQYVHRSTGKLPKESRLLEWLSEFDTLLSRHNATFKTIKEAFVGDNAHKSALFDWVNVHKASVDDLTFGERVYYRENPDSKEAPDGKPSSSADAAVEDEDDDDDGAVAIIM